MSPVSWIFGVVFVGAASADWWSRWRDLRRLESWTKPLALVALIGVAVSLDPADADVRAWFVAALVASLVGDVFLLDGDRYFLAGLASFLVAHVLYTIGFLVAPDWRWGGFAVAAVAMVALILTVGRQIVRAAGVRAPALRGPVAAYLVVISAMAVTAAGAGDAWAIVGAALFVASDSILGWRQFVGSARWMSPAVMVTYHLGQAGLVLSLLGR
jgi:uncharacterized membrane protein YhhN